MFRGILGVLGERFLIFEGDVAGGTAEWVYRGCKVLIVMLLLSKEFIARGAIRHISL